MSERKVYVVLHESVLASWLKDGVTFLTIAAVIGLGWLLDSSAMQWVGAVMAFITILGRAAGAGRSAFRGGHRDAIAFIEAHERGDIQ